MRFQNIIIILLIINIFSISGCNLFKKNKELELKGNFYENSKDFSSYSEDIEISELSQAYLSAINYEITNIDKDNMTITMIVQIPLVTNELSNIVHSVVSSNSDVSYNNLKNEIQEELKNKLSSNTFEIETTEIKLPIEETNGEYKIVTTDEWSELIYGNLRKSYIAIFSQIGDDFK